MAALLALLALGVRGWDGRVVARAAARIDPRWAYAFAFALAATFAARSHVLGTVLQGDRAPLVTYGMPLRVYAWSATAIRASLTDADVAFSLLEMLALGGLLVAVARLPRRQAVALTAACAGAMVCMALRASWLSSPDVYLYAGQAMLGGRAYDPPPTAFGGDLGVINRLWGVPLLPSAYGPVLLAFAAFATGPFPTVAAKLFALKLLGAASFAGCAWLVRLMRAPRVVVVAVACNPALIDLFVQNAHNDLLGVDFVLVAIVARRRGLRAAAVVLAAAAAFVKVTLLLPALLVFVAAPTTRQRVIDATAFVACVTAGYAIAVGPAFASALAYIVRSYPANYGVTERLSLSLAAAAAFAAVAVAFFRRPVVARAAWTFAAVGPFMLPWYLVWGFPWALESPGVALAFLGSLPLAVVICDSGRPPTPLYDVIVGILFAGLLASAALDYLASRRRPRAATRR